MLVTHVLLVQVNKFLSAMTSKQMLCVSQDRAYSEIIVKRGPQF